MPVVPGTKSGTTAVRYAVRWLRRLLEEGERVTLEEAALVVSCLLALGGPANEQARATLSALAERVSTQGRRPRLA